MKEFVKGYMSDKAMEKSNTDEVFVNDKYQVNVKHLDDGWTWLSIKRKDKEALHDWRDLQLIKNMICGEEREGLELYPKESRLVDTSNQYHIFVMPEGQLFPFGYGDRLVVKDASKVMNTGQRPFNDDEVPEDAVTSEELQKQVDEYMKDDRN